MSASTTAEVVRPFPRSAAVPASPAEAAPRPTPSLRVVPRRVRRRRAGLAVASLCLLVFLVLFGLTTFQTLIARKQMSLDATQARIGAALEHQERLRLAVAQRESPGHVIARAAELGMAVPDPAGTPTVYVAPSAEQVAEVSAVNAGAPPLAAEATPVVVPPADLSTLAG